MKTHKRMLAALLLAAMLLSMLAVPAAAADEFVYGSAIMSLGQKGDAAKTVNLTTEGDVAWTYFAVNRPGNNISKADQEDAAIQLSDTKGALSYSTADKIVHFQFTNGANPENNNGSYQTEARGLIFQGKGNGFTLTVPASEAPRTLRIYMGDYKAKLRADIYKGNTLVQSRIFDNQGETKMPMLEIGYCSTEAIKVVITITDVYDSSYGSISLHAATVQDGAEEPELVSGKVTKLEGQTYGINLTDEGNVDWMFFNGNTPEAYEHRRMQERFITEIEGIGDGKYAGQTDDNPLRYTFTNGMFTPEANQMRAPLLVCYGVGTGVSFQVPGGPVERTLHLYCGTWAMESQVKLMVNGEEKYATELFGKTATDDGAFYYVVEITYQTESADDEVEVTFQGVRGYSPAYQNCSLEAITLFSENPPQVTEPDYTEETLETASVYACHPYGRLRELHFKEGEEWLDIPLRTTQSTAGPAWQVNGKSLLLTQKDNDSHAYETTIDGVTYGIAYSAEEDGTLNIQATIQNNSGKQYTPDRASIVLGFDTYMMDRYNDYKDLFFPTLLRCEKDYMWGYFQSPQNKVISFTVDAPVSSYRLNYESSLHRIYTATLDLMQKDAVNRPARHPGSENDVMEAGTSRTWNIKLKLTDGAQQVQQDVAEMVKAPMITADRYTLGENERAQITVYSEKPVQSVTVDKLEDGNAPNVRSKDGEQDTLTTGYISCDALSLRDDGNGMYTASFLPAKGAGVYRLRVIDADGYTSEAIITLRNTWSWYMENAMIQGAKHYPRGGTHAESYYNAYSVYLGEKYFDLEQSTNGQFTEDSFDEIYFRDVYDVIGYEDENGNPINPRESAARIQNHSTTVGQLADRYEATGDVESLKKAIPIVDFLISRQNASGAYMGPSGDYTSVIYPAKSIMELMYHEAELAQTDTENAAFWQENYDKQYASVKKAMDSLVTLDGDLHTEGQLTFEDGAYSCSTTQLSEFALIARSAGDPDWEKYRDSAIRYAVKHEALEQQIIPDSRMNGGSLRFWEAQYDTLVTASPNNMMNSPHGWTAWNIYGLFNLYQLTGDVDYLERGMNAMGSCAQLMGFDGNLYWAFIADPYVPSSQLVQVEGDTSELGTATRRNINIGECYVDTITDWFRSEPGTVVGGYWGQGGSCDNDVHEIFKALEECVLTKAFVVENADGSYTAYNCSTVEENGVLTITADPEELTSEISLTCKAKSPITSPSAMGRRRTALLQLD